MDTWPLQEAYFFLLSGGLMALVFYSNRHGYDDLSGGDNDWR